jgi:hypothetical protein
MTDGNAPVARGYPGTADALTLEAVALMHDAAADKLEPAGSTRIDIYEYRTNVALMHRRWAKRLRDMASTVGVRDHAQCSTDCGNLTFGTFVENIAASDRNPIKRGIFIRKTSAKMAEYATKEGCHSTPLDNLRVAFAMTSTARATAAAGNVDFYAWPVGCHSPNSCHRNGRCMYVGCKYDGEDIAALASLAISSTGSGGAA